MCSENLAVLLTLILSFISPGYMQTTFFKPPPPKKKKKTLLPWTNYVIKLNYTSPSVIILLIVTNSISIFYMFSFSEGKLCERHSPINVLEEEYFSFCCPKKAQHEGQVIDWYKGKKGEEVLIHGDSRIDLNGSNLRFWPILLNDTGIYQCCLRNGTWKTSCKEWSLNVIKRNKSNCFTEEHLLTGRDGIIGTEYFFTCSSTNDTANVINIMWYKDCIENINKRGEEEWYIDQLTEKDGGKYTCVKTILHAGKKYNSTSTTNLNIKDTEEKLLNYIKIYHQVRNSSSDENGKKYVMKQLWFKHVKEKNLNSSYKCVFSENGFEEQTFKLQKESNPDLPVHAFTAGMIMAIMFSFIAVVIVILCVIFKIELVLLFRAITGKDETLGDGKLYDAFVSYLKDCTPICGEERKFALEILPKTLEDHFGYKLCIFERDISPGGAIIDDIQSSIDRSRRLIIILSQNYVSDQVMYELEIGLHKALVERKIRVILIEYMPKNDFDFLPKSLELLSSSQVVKWKEEKSLPLNSKFWKKLCYAMPAKPTISAACQGYVYSVWLSIFFTQYVKMLDFCLSDLFTKWGSNVNMSKNNRSFMKSRRKEICETENYTDLHALLKRNGKQHLLLLIRLKDCLKKHTNVRYRAISNHKFIVSCDLPSEDTTSIYNHSALYENHVMWFRQSSDGGATMILSDKTANPTPLGNSLWFNPIKPEHSGIYICMKRDNISPCVNILITVQTKIMANCSVNNINDIYLFVDQGTAIGCPGKNCYSNFQQSSVKWYKNGVQVKLKKKRPGLQFYQDKLVLRSVYDKDNGTYTCDFILTDNGTQWKMRTILNVHVLNPSDGMTLEVEIGQPIDLECKAQFGFEMNVSSSLEWYRETSKSKQLIQQERVHPEGLDGQTFSLTFKLIKVTEEDLNSHFICLAQNSIGNATGVIKLKRQTEK
ncbi:Interleukin-18 receptor 1, partial [Ophiophagus hannah]